MAARRDNVVAGRPEGYYRRKAAGWLTAAASFRRCAANGGHPFGLPYALQMARDAVAMAAENRRRAK